MRWVLPADVLESAVTSLRVSLVDRELETLFQFAKQIGGEHAERAGKLDDRGKRRLALAAFNVGDRAALHVGKSGKISLR